MKRILKPLYTSSVSFVQYFTGDSRSVGILLLICTAISLVIANTGAGLGYLHFFNAGIHLPFAETIHLPHSFLHWINDGLMAVFFFLAGIEIKRELTGGELSSFSKAILPVGAAIGGMIIPAAFYFVFNYQTVYQSGWGIPMATDIAFSLGIAALLGSRVPVGLKIFLTALAIIDDLGAIATIAIFYSSSLQWIYLVVAVAIIVVLYLLMRNNIFNSINFILGIALWYCFFNSGIHATVAGVVFAFLIPTKKLEHIEHWLYKPVNFIIMPVFALANTAIIFPADVAAGINSTLSWGIIAGLLLGKPLGIFISSFILVKTKLGQLPSQTTWQHIVGAGILAGIGFTMSIFIATLAFGDIHSQDISKIAVLAGSVLSILLSFLWFKFFCKPLTQ